MINLTLIPFEQFLDDLLQRDPWIRSSEARDIYTFRLLLLCSPTIGCGIRIVCLHCRLGR